VDPPPPLPTPTEEEKERCVGKNKYRQMNNKRYNKRENERRDIIIKYIVK
jgi:hypothetical protein